MTNYRIVRASDSEDLARQASQTIAAQIALTLDQRDRCQIALSGGSTPSKAYALLGQEHLPWDRVDVVLGDERWVSADDDSSNARMLRQTLLAEGPASVAAFHPVPTVELKNAEASAVAMADLVSRLCPANPPIFDVMLLGLGDDGHTASLFPGTDAPPGDRPMGNRWTGERPGSHHPDRSSAQRRPPSDLSCEWCQQTRGASTTHGSNGIFRAHSRSTGSTC